MLKQYHIPSATVIANRYTTHRLARSVNTGRVSFRRGINPVEIGLVSMPELVCILGNTVGSKLELRQQNRGGAVLHPLCLTCFP